MKTKKEKAPDEIILGLKNGTKVTLTDPDRYKALTGIIVKQKRIDGSGVDRYNYYLLHNSAAWDGAGPQKRNGEEFKISGFKYSRSFNPGTISKVKILGHARTVVVPTVVTVAGYELGFYKGHFMIGCSKVLNSFAREIIKKLID